MPEYRRWGKLLNHICLPAGEWVRIPGARGVELYQHSGPPLVVHWFAFGNLPHGVAMTVRADIYNDDRPPIPGYWDLTQAHRHCLIRHAGPTDTPHAAQIEEVEDQIRQINKSASHRP